METPRVVKRRLRPHSRRSLRIPSCLQSICGLLGGPESAARSLGACRSHPRGLKKMGHTRLGGKQVNPPDMLFLCNEAAAGGLDSLGGVLEEDVRDKKSSLLITHESTTKLRGRHRTLRSMVANATSGPAPQFITVRVNKKNQQEREYTQRVIITPRRCAGRCGRGWRSARGCGYRWQNVGTHQAVRGPPCR